LNPSNQLEISLWDIWKDIFIWNNLNFAFEHHENCYKVSARIGYISETEFGEVEKGGTFFLGGG